MPEAVSPPKASNAWVAPPRTNTFAIIGLVAGLSGLSLVALMFGCLAFGDIERRREDGYGMATAAIFLGVFGIIAWAILLSTVLYQ